MVKWQGRQGSSNIEDRRGQGGGGLGGGFGAAAGSSPLGQGGGFRLPTGRSRRHGRHRHHRRVHRHCAGVRHQSAEHPHGGDTGTNVPFQQTLPPQNASEDELARFRRRDGQGHRGLSGASISAQQGDTYAAPTRGAVLGPDGVGLRRGRYVERPVLLPQRFQGLHRPGLLRPAARPVRRARRLRAGLCDRA